MRKYDTTFIVDGDLSQDEREAIIRKFRDSLERNGAEIDRIVRWGMRTLAYEIKKKSRGYYVIFYYAAEPKVIKEVERELRLNENILRYMTILFDGPHPSYIPDEGEPGTSSAPAPAPAPAPADDEDEEAAAEADETEDTAAEDDADDSDDSEVSDDTADDATEEDTADSDDTTGDTVDEQDVTPEDDGENKEN